MKPINPAPQQPAPPVTEINALLALYTNRRYAEAESGVRALLKRYPEFGFGWKLLGGILQMQGMDALPASRQVHVTFGCFQNLTKAGDEVLAAWGKILAALPDAKLRWQCKQFGDPEVVKQQGLRLQQHGIDPARVALQKSTSRKDYLAAHAEVDLILDTFPYPGATTTCEALWMGVPTITLAGETLLARQGASLLAAPGLAEWIANSVEDYIAKAINLAGDLTGLAVLRAGLREQVRTSPLFDAKRFAKNFEDAL